MHYTVHECFTNKAIMSKSLLRSEHERETSFV